MLKIDDLKRALREVRDICARQQFCADCPLRGKNNGCPTRDSMDESTEYPENWSLEWETEEPGTWDVSQLYDADGNTVYIHRHRECGYESRGYKEHGTPYCPNCGKKMKEASE